jgi:hypothetical protein
MKFKLWDTVKIVRNNDIQEFPVGTFGTITAVFSDHYEVYSDYEFWYYDDYELELVQPKKRWWQFWK